MDTQSIGERLANKKFIISRKTLFRICQKIMEDQSITANGEKITQISRTAVEAIQLTTEFG